MKILFYVFSTFYCSILLMREDIYVESYAQNCIFMYFVVQIIVKKIALKKTLHLWQKKIQWAGKTLPGSVPFSCILLQTNTSMSAFVSDS